MRRRGGAPRFIYWRTRAYRELRFRGRGTRNRPLAVEGPCGPGDLRGKRTANRLRRGCGVGFGILPEPVLYGGDPDQGQPRFWHVEPAAANLWRRRSSRGGMRGILTVLQQRYAHQGAGDGSGDEAVFPGGKRLGGRRRGGLYIWGGGCRSRCGRAMKSKLFQTAIGRDILYVAGRNCATWTTRRGGSRTTRCD